MLKKSVFLAIALLVVGFTIVYAQVPLPPLPNVTLTMPTHTAFKVNVTSAQLRQLLEIRDQRYYVRYLFRSGYITEDDYKRRDLPLEQAEVDIFVPIAEADPVAYVWADGTVKDALNEIWTTARGWRGPGYPIALMNKIFGFVIPQPQGTRASSFAVEYEDIRDRVFDTTFTPYSDQLFNNYKQQFDSHFGTPEFVSGPSVGSNTDNYRYVLRSNKSADGRPYLINLGRHTDSSKREAFMVDVWILGRDP